MTSGELRIVGPVEAARVPARPLEFLRELGGPVAIRVEGRDRSRTRVLVTLLHGNEPSGFFAVHAWLREGRRPATDVLVVLGGVDAALVAPALSRRMLPDGRDLNRLFTARADLASDTLAGQIVETIEAARPEALVDVHNNTGHSPAYGVVTREGREEACLVSLFARRVVRYDLRLGALVELTSEVCPSIVVEAGRVGDPAADEVARAGVERFLEADCVTACDDGSLEAFIGPIRVEVAPTMRVAFGMSAGAGADLTVDEEIDRHNFETIPAGTTIGWLRSGAAWPLVAVGADGRERSRELFDVAGDVIAARRALVPIMMTTDAGIARSDCLFYVVEPLEGSSDESQ